MRKFCLYLAVVSMTLLTLISISNSLRFESRTQGNWTFYTPYSKRTAYERYAEFYYAYSEAATRILFPVSMLSLAGYLLALEHHIRKSNPSQGFTVKIAADE